MSFHRLKARKIKHLYGNMKNILDADGNIIGQVEDDDITNKWFIGEDPDRIWDYVGDGVWQQDEAEEDQQEDAEEVSTQSIEDVK